MNIAKLIHLHLVSALLSNSCHGDSLVTYGGAWNHVLYLLYFLTSFTAETLNFYDERLDIGQDDLADITNSTILLSVLLLFS